MIDLFELKPEKFYGLKENELFKEQKINDCLDGGKYVASLKKDGNYARFVSQKEQKIQTRGISTKTGTYGEVQEKVPHVFNFLKELVPDNSLIVGELYYHNGTTNEVGSILRCLPPKAIKRQQDNPLIFYIFDIWYWNNENLMIKTKLERIAKMQEIAKKWKSMGYDVPYIEFAEYTEDCRELMEKAFEENEEGIVLTLKDSIVNPGARTAWKTLKIKKELQNDADVFLTGNYKLPERDYEGKELPNWEYWMNEKTNEMVFGKLYEKYIEGATIIPVKKTYFMGWPASLEMGVIDEDTHKVVSIGWISGLSDEIKQDFIDNIPKYTRKVMRINAMETTEDLKLRHSKFIDFRDDITYEDCTLQKIFNK